MNRNMYAFEIKVDLCKHFIVRYVVCDHSLRGQAEDSYRRVS